MKDLTLKIESLYSENDIIPVCVHSYRDAMSRSGFEEYEELLSNLRGLKKVFIFLYGCDESTTITPQDYKENMFNSAFLQDGLANDILVDLVKNGYSTEQEISDYFDEYIRNVGKEIKPKNYDVSLLIKLPGTDCYNLSNWVEISPVEYKNPGEGVLETSLPLETILSYDHYSHGLSPKEAEKALLELGEMKKASFN
ncbi:hypothetical protein KY321_01885 [Candidatus Woesearchaeota archaeon]|nr:hypothetical protein [Candidatus Woesearchaeota archaeon]